MLAGSLHQRYTQILEPVESKCHLRATSKFVEVLSVALGEMAMPPRRHVRAYLYYPLLSNQGYIPCKVVLEVSRYVAMTSTAVYVAARLGRSLCRSTLLHIHMHRPGAEAKPLPSKYRYPLARCSAKFSICLKRTEYVLSVSHKHLLSLEDTPSHRLWTTCCSHMRGLECFLN